MLSVAGVHAFYGPSHVLHGVSIHVERGEVVALLGRNGMGKTTLVHTVLGFLKPAEGEILLDGKSIAGSAPESIFQRGVTLMPQGHRVFGSLSVGENLTVAVRETNESIGWSIDRVLDRFPILKERWDQGADTMSGGEQQMLTMGRTLVGNGSIVMLDEPAEGLAPSIVERFSEIISDLRRDGVGVLLVEQRFDFALSLADRVYVMSRGVEVFVGTPDELRARNDIKEEYLSL
ncbi:MAG: ABC transporter ATP-binding protein [Acidimicrobiia bacterium]